MNPARPARPRISRIQAFADQGVELAYPVRSWSGVRELRGGVVIAMRADDVQSCFDGFRCLLWAPEMEGGATNIDRPIRRERLEHCRLATAFGGADGLLLAGPGALAERGTVLPLRVERRRAEYWAFWGNAMAIAGAEEPPYRESRLCEAERLVA